MALRETITVSKEEPTKLVELNNGGSAIITNLDENPFWIGEGDLTTENYQEVGVEIPANDKFTIEINVPITLYGYSPDGEPEAQIVSVHGYGTIL